MTGRPRGHDKPRTELEVTAGGRRIRVGMPSLRVRKLPTGAQPPAPGSAVGGTGTPKHSIRCPNELWGGALQRLHGRGLELSPVLRGYLAAIVRGEATLYPDPLGEPSTVEDDWP